MGVKVGMEKEEGDEDDYRNAPALIKDNYCLDSLARKSRTKL